MDAWVIWVVVAVALLIAEATTSAFVAIYFGLAAIAAAAIAAAGLDAAVQLIAEATTSAFVAIYFGLAAIAAAATAAAGLDAAVQLIAFAALSVGSLVLTRPALKRAAGSATGIRTGVDAMQGRIGVVTRPIAALEPGQVKVGGEMWTARSFYDEEPIAVGSRVEVVKVEGVTALVVPAPSPHDELAPDPEGQSHG